MGKKLNYAWLLAAIISLSGCSNDGTPEPDDNLPGLEEARLMSLTVESDGNTSTTLLEYDADKVTKVILSDGSASDTTYVSYNGNFVYLSTRSSGFLLLDTLTVTDNKISAISGVKLDGSTLKQTNLSSFIYNSSGVQKYVRKVKTIRSIPTPLDTKNYFFELLSDSNNVKDYSYVLPEGLVGDPYRMHFHYTLDNIDSIMIYNGLTYGSGVIDEKYIVEKTGDVITYSKYNASNVYLGKSVVEINPSIGKMVSIRRYDASNQLIYSETRNYIVGNSNHANILINNYSYDDFVIGSAY